MTEYDRLKKIIPQDQALANQALSRSLRQVKKIFDTTLPQFANVVINLESNKGLDLINALTTPVPAAVANFYANTFPTGTGVGNSITTYDMVGIAAGATANEQLPVLIDVIDQLDDLGQLDALTGNGGSGSSVQNGIYTLMEYALAGTYSGGNVELATTVPATNYYPGGSFSNVEVAFTSGGGLIGAANAWIGNIAANNSSLAASANSASDQIAQQLVRNQNNLVLAGIDVANVVIGDWANSNIQSNQQSAALSFAGQLHDLGLDISEDGPGQFIAQVANTSTVTGQATISSLREGRNIALFSAAGMGIDTQLPDVNPDTPLANNLSSGQYSAAEAAGNIVI